MCKATHAEACYAGWGSWQAYLHASWAMLRIRCRPEPAAMLLRLVLLLPAGKTIAPVAPACLQQLSAQLLAVCANPTQPGFNHYLFESVAALVRCAPLPTPVPALPAMCCHAPLGCHWFHQSAQPAWYCCSLPTARLPSPCAQSAHPHPHPHHPTNSSLRRFGCEADPAAVAQYEAQLFPPFQVVLVEDVQEFHP